MRPTLSANAARVIHYKMFRRILLLISYNFPFNLDYRFGKIQSSFTTCGCIPVKTKSVFCLFVFFLGSPFLTAKLRWVDLTLISREDCEKVYGDVITEDKYCCSTAGEKATCTVSFSSFLT